MKLLLLGLLLGVGSPAAAKTVLCGEEHFGPCTPTRKERTTILEHVRRGNKFHGDWVKFKEQAEWLGWKLSIEKDRRGESWSRTVEDAPLDAKLQEWEELRNAANDAKQNAQAELNTALQLVMSGYEIDLPPQGLITGGPAKDLAVDSRVSVHFEEESFLDAFTTKDGETVYVVRSPQALGQVAGSTSLNGRIILTMNAFRLAALRNNPGEIAVVLFHERFHRQSLTNGHWYSKAPAELQSYGYSHDLADIFELEPESESRNFLEERIAEFDKQVHKRERVLFKKGITTVDPPYPWWDEVLDALGLKPSFPTKADLEKNRLEYNELENNLEEAYENESELVLWKRDRLVGRLEREAKARRKREAEDERRRQHESRVRAEASSMDALFTLTERACNTNKGGHWSIVTPANMRILWRNLPMYPDFGERRPDSNCARQLLDQLVEMRRIGREAPTMESVGDMVAAIDAEAVRKNNERWQAYLNRVRGVADMLEFLCLHPGSKRDFPGELDDLDSMVRDNYFSQFLPDMAVDPNVKACYAMMVKRALDWNSGARSQGIEWFRPTAGMHSPHRTRPNPATSPVYPLARPDPPGRCPDGSPMEWAEKIGKWACPVR